MKKLIINFLTNCFPRILLISIFMFHTPLCKGQRIYGLPFGQNGIGVIGVWQAGKTKAGSKGPYTVGGVSSWDEFFNGFKLYSKEGYRLVDIEDVGENIVGVYETGSGGYSLIVHSSWKDFTAAWQTESKKGLRLIDFEMMNVKGTNWFVGVFRAGKGRYYLWRVSNWNKLIKKVDELNKKGYSLIDVEVDYFNPRNSSYTGVWISGQTGLYIYRLEGWQTFAAKWEELGQKNYRLIDIELQIINNKLYYIGVWHHGNEGYYLWADKYSNLKEEVKKIKNYDLQLVDVEFYSLSSNNNPPSGQGAGKPIKLTTKVICFNDQVPDGWVATSISITPVSCPDVNLCYRAKVITQYSDLPVGYRLNICKSNTVPNGWKVVNEFLSTRCLFCPSGDNHMIVIERVK